MKSLLGLTGLWRFPITGEETWAGVGEYFSPFSDTDSFQVTRRFSYVTPTQQYPRFAPRSP